MKKQRPFLILAIIFFVLANVPVVIGSLNLLPDNSSPIVSAVSAPTALLSLCFFLIFTGRLGRTFLIRRLDISHEDNLRSRKMLTQINIVERVWVFLVVLFTIIAVLMTFESIRKIGIGLFASAGVAGIILGLSAQKLMATLLAGLQLAFTQPFRLDDAVFVENEWGWIEEMTLTYVVIRIWDRRRLVLPSSYFIEKPFQNWTRKNAQIIGTVFLYTDYSINFDSMRKKLTEILEGTELWDGEVKVLQVTDSHVNYVESRILVSAKNSPRNWDLRVLVREKMIEFIQEKYPESLARSRIELHEKVK